LCVTPFFDMKIDGIKNPYKQYTEEFCMLSSNINKGVNYAQM